MSIQELNYDKDKDIILIQFPKDEDLELVKPILNSVYETFVKRTNSVLAISDDMDISIIHVNEKKEDASF